MEMINIKRNFNVGVARKVVFLCGECEMSIENNFYQFTLEDNKNSSVFYFDRHLSAINPCLSNDDPKPIRLNLFLSMPY